MLSEEPRDRPEQTEEIEITPAMIEAGVDVYGNCDPRLELASEVVRQVFAAMHAEMLREKRDGPAQ